MPNKVSDEFSFTPDCSHSSTHTIIQTFTRFQSTRMESFKLAHPVNQSLIEECSSVIIDSYIISFVNIFVKTAICKQLKVN